MKNPHIRDGVRHMLNEFEAKCIVESVADARARLERIGARCIQSERLMRRAVFDFPDQSLDRRGAWVRVRDEGNRITMSYKQAPEHSAIGDCFETELTIDSYDHGVAFCVDLGMTQKSYQETRRESWATDDAQFDVDTWPGVPSFIEVEAGTEDIVRHYVEVLGFSWSSALFGGAGIVYEHYLGFGVGEANRLPEITFANPPLSR